ncbi:uncharacterized protein LOC144749567 [Ciona intestinalis]
MNVILFFQRNLVGDSITLKLENGDVIFTLQSIADNINTSVRYEGNFNNNEWIHVMFQHNSTTDQGSSLYLSIGNHTNLLYNSITDPTIFNMEFSESSVTYIGGNEDSNGNFNGCLSSGPYFNFQPYNGTNVQWNNCPLLSTNICGPKCNDSICNNGACIATNSEISCQCPNNTYGPLCQYTGYNPCLNATCGNGTCTSSNSSHYICICDKGFTGENCENMIRDCESDPCYNHGICHDLINSYECDCENTGYTGPQCNMDINECNSNPCLNGATCFNRIGDYICLCTPGFEGINCDVNINECHSNPCLNEGVCIDGVNGYSCQCDMGYYGKKFTP